MTRHFLKAVARGLIGVVLLTQMMISAYACPAMSQLAVKQISAASVSANEQSNENPDLPMAQMSNCEDMAGAMDASLPNLCAEHCKVGQQSDHAPSLDVPTVTLTPLYVTPQVPVMAPPQRPAAATLSALVAASPPHAILHCVHRI